MSWLNVSELDEVLVEPIYPPAATSVTLASNDINFLQEDNIDERFYFILFYYSASFLFCFSSNSFYFNNNFYIFTNK